MGAAFAELGRASEFSFTLTSAPADIEVVFKYVDGRANNELAHAVPPKDGGDLTIDSAEAWSVDGHTPDLTSVTLHELGHAMGLRHSSVADAVMFPASNTGDIKRELTVDDELALRVLYSGWTSVGGIAYDIGVGANGDVWATGAQPIGDAGSPIYKFNPASSGWEMSVDEAGRPDRAGVLIAVDSHGRPWTVDQSGAIWSRTSSGPTGGTWVQRPGCAQDIGIGGDTIWIVGCSRTGNAFEIEKWNGATQSFEPHRTLAVRISVDHRGCPWIVDGAGNVFRAITCNSDIPDWELVQTEPPPGSRPTIPVARDIAVAPSNSMLDQAWIVTTGGYVYTWNGQDALAEGQPQPTRQASWRVIDNNFNRAWNIGVGPHQAWIVTPSNSVLSNGVRR